MSKPLLIVFLGFPGSGKTYFSRNLSEKLHAVTFNSDAIRISMFGSLQNIEKIRASDRSRLYEDVFGAMDYATRQALKAGYSVIYDAQQTKRENRLKIEKLADESGAIPILVWMRTRRETALRRGQEREVRDDSHRYTAELMERVIDRFADETELPQDGENVVEIDGEAPFEVQYLSFEEQVSKIFINHHIS